MKNLLNAFYSDWEQWQIIVFFVLVALVVVLLAYIITFIFLLKAHPSSAPGQKAEESLKQSQKGGK